jgi:hypothetical protein
MTQTSLAEKPHSETFSATYDAFASSTHGTPLQGRARWSSYKPEDVANTDWIRLLGPNVDALEHHAYCYAVTDCFLYEMRHAPEPKSVRFSEEEEAILRLVAVSNNWAAGDPSIGDIPLERRGTDDDKRERKIFGPIFEQIADKDLLVYKDDVEEILFGDRSSKLGQAWDAIEGMTYMLDAIAAYQASIATDDTTLKGHLRWMAAGALPNQTELLQEYAQIFSPIRDFLIAHEELITEIYHSLEATVYEAHGQRERPKVVQLQKAKDRWDQRDLAEVINRPVRVTNFEHISTEDLMDRMRHIEFRGVYSSNGEPLRPYQNARISLAQVFPQNSETSPPMLIRGTKGEAVWTPQPTIYEDQLAIIDTVWKALERAGISPFELDHAVNYDWQTWDADPTRFAIMPPVIEQQQFLLDHGRIDLGHLASLFTGAYIKDARGQLHSLEARFLEGYYIDQVSASPHLDIFHPQLPLINYGQHLTGTWDVNIVCDGAHRLDLATETYRRPITVVVVEPAIDGPPLIPYYALPMPVLPNMRLSSKAIEALYPNLTRDKWHLLNDILKKLLHYDWTTGGLNVSSLRSQVGGR